MFSDFSHYLSYGSTDQATMRDLYQSFDGLLVPGTIAAFQAEGTRGFVLSLSAGRSVPYVIDSRFPLFQNQLVAPKKSHLMLADVFGAPGLVRGDRNPVPDDFDQALDDQVASRWVEFNLGFEDVALKTFDKYARRLGEEIPHGDRRRPEYILPPYFMTNGRDGWWEASGRLWQRTLHHAALAGAEGMVRRVVATTDAAALEQLLPGIDDPEVVIWVSNLDEFRLESEAALVSYSRAIAGAGASGQRLFALYGGFFAVLVSRFGLAGASHGIGFGEHRDWVELPSSGAPPARYYVPRLHRYVGVDIATTIWQQFPELIRCDCSECRGRPPGALTYHELMKHSVRARTDEIRDWLPLDTAAVVSRLSADARAFADAVYVLRAPAGVVRRAEGTFQHLHMWCRVLDAAARSAP